jgi:hypothetical protein
MHNPISNKSSWDGQPDVRVCSHMPQDLCYQDSIEKNHQPWNTPVTGHPASPNSHPMDIWVERPIETQTAHKWAVLLNGNLTSECGMCFPEGPPNFIQIGCIHAVIWKWFHIADPMGLCVKKNPQHALRMETATSLNLCDQFFWKLERINLVALTRSCPKDFVLA